MRQKRLFEQCERSEQTGRTVKGGYRWLCSKQASQHRQQYVEEKTQRRDSPKQWTDWKEAGMKRAVCVKGPTNHHGS